MSFTGVGGEQIWICPTLDNTNPFDDLSGNGNNGTATGGVTTVADTGSGGSFAFDIDVKTKGVSLPNDYIDGLTEYSMSVWVKLTTSPTAPGNILGAYTSANSNANPSFLTLSAGRLFEYGITDSGSTVGNQIENPVTTNVWKHLAVTYKQGTGLYVYQNGVEVGSDPPQFVFTGASALNFSIGKGQANGSISLVDDARVFHHELTTADITLLASTRGYNTGGPPPATGFYNPFISKTFSNQYTRRIR